jgi:hypothetical protein
MELTWNCDLIETWEKNNSLPNLPGAYYFSEFLTENESKNLFAFCKEVPKTKRGYISGLSGRLLSTKVKVLSIQDQK